MAKCFDCDVFEPRICFVLNSLELELRVGMTMAKLFKPAKMSRRTFISNTALGGLVAPTLLTNFGSRIFGQKLATTKPFILWVHCDGGWDQTMVFDNKIGLAGVAQESGAEGAKGLKDIAFVKHSSRAAVQTFFETYGDKTAIVNGLFCGSLAHEMALRRELGTAIGGRFGDWLSYYCSSFPGFNPLPHVVIDAPFMPGSLSTNAVHLTAESLLDYNDTVTAPAALGTDAEKALAEYLEGAYSNTDAASAAGLDGQKMTALIAALKREDSTKTMFKEVSTATGSGSDSKFVSDGKFALELFGRGYAQAATIQAGGRRAWDSHGANFASQSTQFQELFADLSKILKHAESVNLGAANLLICVTSEMGRAPVLNADGGKDHWPYTSALLWGACVKGGAVVGGSDEQLRGVKVNPLFGTLGESDGVVLDMSYVMAAFFATFGLATDELLPGILPLSAVLES